MEHIAAILLLVACTDDFGACREIPADTPQYMTLLDCEKDLEPALIRITRTAPQAFAQCIALDPAKENDEVQVSWKIGSDGEFLTHLQYTDVVIASAMVGGAGSRDRAAKP